MNIELLTHEVATHAQDLRQEAEQQRLLTHLPRRNNAAMRHTIAHCGVMLVKVGMKLKQVETPHVIPSA